MPFNRDKGLEQSVGDISADAGALISNGEPVDVATSQRGQEAMASTFWIWILYWKVDVREREVLKIWSSRRAQHESQRGGAIALPDVVGHVSW
ncbi:hypothetical protein [Bradyrhizobium sp. Arg816]|uniref:hypothetical protein n=1 Tax=Bradyrhizobium sp. Arg816 TaxID=2998491 RepID=UPI00249DD352|nr:hypothetical protein [Bradyrhizobium sp. Arg816]MDI3566968.1 hypothetical protein [Bradyrhizobium sp. Arg816]